MEDNNIYVNDILGDGFKCKKIELEDDYEGEVKAILIRRLSDSKSKTSVLYIHGYNDYFFQKHLAKHINKSGYNFYALELRKYGRSHLPHQKWFNLRNISEYYPEINKTIDIMEREGSEKIVINAHSTGALIMANYLNYGKKNGKIKLALFNSPFFEYNLNWVLRKIVIPTLIFLFRYKLDMQLNNPKKKSENYGKRLHKKYQGEWNYNLKWKFNVPPSINVGWIRAIYLAQKKLRTRSNIEIPLVIFSSNKSYKKNVYDKTSNSSDIILNIDHMIKYGKKLGNEVYLEIIPSAIHDIALSLKPVRELYFEKLIYWIKKI